MAVSPKIILSGIQPTSRITLGNYIGAIKNWVSLANEYQCYYMAVDLHAITVRQDPAALRNNTLFAVAAYVAAGLDSRRSTLFLQSHVRQHAELAWILNCYTYMGELGRMTQFKDKSERAGQNICVGLFTYPALMAADILLYDADLVPVGADQKQHVELTRDIAQRVNALYGDDTFKVPEPFIPKVGARIMDLQNPQAKMSKSASTEAGAIFLTDAPKDIEKKFKRAVTDSGSDIIFDPATKPGVSNLLDIQAALTGHPIAELVTSYQGKQYGHLKVETAEIVIEALRPLQENIRRLLDDQAELERILAAGAETAAAHAERTLQRVMARIGFAPRPRT